MDEQRMDRRTLFRLVGGGAAALAVPMILPADDASAGITWCRTDPVVTLNGNNPMGIECGSGFSDPGASANDNCDVC